MLIVPDANILIRDYHFKGAASRSLLDSAKSVGAQLCVPRCVLDEVQEHFEQDLRRAADQLDSAAKSLGRLLDKNVKSPGAIRDFAVEASKYRAHLEKRIKDAGGKILDYPTYSPEEVIQRAVKHKKPFASKGDQGFKDYLVWKNVLDLAQRAKTQIRLVTANKTDFGDGQGALHPDLLADLDSLGVPRDRVTLGDSFDMILTAFVMPALQEVRETADQLKRGTFAGLNVANWIYGNLAENINIEKVLDLRRALRREFETPTVEGISGVMRDDILDVRRLPSGEFLIEVEADVEAEVGFFIHRSDYYVLEDEVSAAPWSDHYLHGTTYVTMTVHLLLTFDPEQEDVTSWDVVSASAISATKPELLDWP
jgi:PIN domain-containing protein